MDDLHSQVLILPVCPQINLLVKATHHHNILVGFGSYVEGTVGLEAVPFVALAVGLLVHPFECAILVSYEPGPRTLDVGIAEVLFGTHVQNETPDGCQGVLV